MITAVILAAGAGTRLGVLGQRCSKAMVPIGGRPLLDWVMERLDAAGVGRMVVVGHVADAPLAAWLGKQHPEVTIVVQRERRGIADAVGCALPVLGDVEAYLACACDSLFDRDDLAALITTGRAERGDAAVGVLEMGAEATAARSAVRLAHGRVVEIVEKPDPARAPSGLVAAPLYWLPRSVDDRLRVPPPAGGERYVSTVLGDFIAAGGRVHAVHLRGRIEVTTAADVARAEALLHTERKR